MKNQENKDKIFLSIYDTNHIPTGYQLCKYDELEKIKDNSLTDIFITDLLDYYTDNQIPNIIESIISKLANNGILHIQSIDLEQFAIYLTHKVIPIEHKKMLFGNKNNIQTLSLISNLIIYKYPNIKILLRQYINGYEYYLKLQVQK